MLNYNHMRNILCHVHVMRSLGTMTPAMRFRFAASAKSLLWIQTSLSRWYWAIRLVWPTSESESPPRYKRPLLP